VVAGSDWSVSSMNPLHGIEVALTRRGETQPPGGPVFIPEEQVPLAPMLVAYTREGVWLDRWEDVTGTITGGKRADLAILERNLFELAAHEISEVQVASTMFEGQVVYAGPNDRVSTRR